MAMWHSWMRAVCLQQGHCDEKKRRDALGRRPPSFPEKTDGFEVLLRGLFHRRPARWAGIAGLGFRPIGRDRRLEGQRLNLSSEVPDSRP